MNISKILRKYTDTFDKLSDTIGWPATARVTFEVIYLGDQSSNELFIVTIKESKSGLGWLYSGSHAVVYKYKGSTNYIDLVTLREFAQEKLKEKKFVAMGGEMEINKMQKFNDGSIYGYLDLQEVISISTAV
jgi:hypothetical protein